MFKAVQKIVVNGRSAQVTIPRPLLFALGMRPGDFVEITEDERGGMTIRPWINREYSSHHSPGQIAPEPPTVKR